MALVIEPGAGEAKEARALGDALRKGDKIRIRVNGRDVELRGSVLATVRASIDALAQGSVSVVAVEKELSTQDAATLLNVSRQYVVRMIDSGKLKADTTDGGHRKVKMRDLLAFQRERDARRRKALDEIEELTESSGGYSKLKR